MIRTASIDDTARIAEIYRYYVEESVASFETVAPTPEEMAGRMRGILGRYPFLVAEEDGCIKGYAYAHEWKARAAYADTWETTIYLDKDCCGRGLGRRLMERLIEECRRGGARALIADITAGNQASERLHAGLGFERVSYFPKVGHKLGRELDVTDYQLILEPQNQGT